MTWDEVRRFPCPQPRGAERLGELHKVGIHKVGFVLAAEILVEVSGDVSVSAVVEDHRYRVDPVLDGRREFGGVVHEPAVPDNADHGTVRRPGFHAE